MLAVNITDEWHLPEVEKLKEWFFSRNVDLCFEFQFGNRKSEYLLPP